MIITIYNVAYSIGPTLPKHIQVWFKKITELFGDDLDLAPKGIRLNAYQRAIIFGTVTSPT